ncbi:MAG: adenylate kinase [Clostridia bacterium]|nr:adenylate kinase [Clostridia bacterium]
MNKVIIIGCPGGGKSTFSKVLQVKTGLPLYHLDMLFWNNDKTHVSRDVFDQRLSDVLNQDKWIIDGNYSRTLETRLIECDTVFLLDLPVEECLAGISNRIGKPRDDMPWIEQEIDKEFKNWIIDFPHKELPRIYELLKKYSDKNIIIFNSRPQIEKYLEKI